MLFHNLAPPLIIASQAAHIPLASLGKIPRESRIKYLRRVSPSKGEVWGAQSRCAWVPDNGTGSCRTNVQGGQSVTGTCGFFSTIIQEEVFVRPVVFAVHPEVRKRKRRGRVGKGLKREESLERPERINLCRLLYEGHKSNSASEWHSLESYNRNHQWERIFFLTPFPHLF